ncbi:hypothetical protein RhoFasGS6_04766 [Rhodococcus fascians]|nr:hypothetical protein [Rhodococcus fascians]
MDDLRVASQRRRAEQVRLVAESFEDVARHVDEATFTGVGYGLHENQVSHAIEEVDGEATGVVARVHHLVDGAEQCAAVSRGQCVDGLVDQRDVGDAEQGQSSRVGDAFRSGSGQQLVHDRQRVTRRTATRADDEWIDRVLDRDLFLTTDLLEQAAHRRRREQSERVVVGSRADGGEHLLGLGGREDEDQVLRRFLDDLEQRVEAGRGDHVRLVDDEDDVARLGRGVHGFVSKVAGIVDATVAGCVHLDDVEVAGPARCQCDAGVAHTAGGGGRSFGTVQRSGEDARRGRLSAATRA